MVIVEPPCTVLWLERFLTAARTTPAQSTPLWGGKRSAPVPTGGSLRDLGIFAPDTGWRSSLDWMKPRRVPSAARTSDCEPSSRGFSESSGGADDAIEIT